MKDLTKKVLKAMDNWIEMGDDSNPYKATACYLRAIALGIREIVRREK